MASKVYPVEPIPEGLGPGDPRCSGFWYSSFHPSCQAHSNDWWTGSDSSLQQSTRAIQNWFYDTPPMKTPPAAKAQPVDTSKVPAPLDAAGYAAHQQAIIDQQMREWQAQNQQYFESIAPTPSTALGPWLLAALAAGGISIAAIFMRRR